MSNNKYIWDIHFIGDLHLGAYSVMKWDERPYTSVDEMHEGLIENHNKVVKPNDMTFFVGDTFHKIQGPKARTLISRMNGRKIAVRGNHDLNPKQMMNLGMDFVCESFTYEILQRPVLICHFPYPYSRVKQFFHQLKKGRPDKFKEKRPVDNGQFLICAHTHSKVKRIGRVINVTAKAWNNTPASLSAIEKLMREAIEEGY